MNAEREPRRRGVRTLPEQIADDIGAAIARGEYKSGERLLELDLSAQFQVSRGPVREALRILVQRGLAQMYPRRGAFVMDVSLDGLIDVFNMRIVLMGLASRYFAHMADDVGRKVVAERIAEVQRVANIDTTDPIHFRSVVTRVGSYVAHNCSSPALAKLIDVQAESSGWSALWATGRIDFLTQERRLESADLYRDFGAAIGGKDGVAAEAVMRTMLRLSLDSALVALRATRQEGYDMRRLS